MRLFGHFLFIITLGISVPVTAQDSLAVSKLIRSAKDAFDVDTDSALTLVKKAYELAENLDNEYLMASALDHMCVVLKSQGKWQESISAVDQALSIWIKLGHHNETGISYLHLGNIYMREGDIQQRNQDFTMSDESYSLALNAYRKALDEFRITKDTLNQARAHVGIGAVHFQLFNDDEALKNFNRSATLVKLIRDSSLTATILNNIGLIYESKGIRDSAILYQQKSRDILIRMNDLNHLVGANINLAVLFESEQPYKTIKLLEEADSIATVLGLQVQRALIHDHLYVIYSDLKEYRMALKHLEMYQAITDSILNMEFKSEELKVRYEATRQKEMIERQKSEYLQKELQLAETESQRNQSIIIGGLVIFVLVVIFMIYYYRERERGLIQKQREKLNQQKIIELERTRKLEAAKAMLDGQEKERIRIAEDLHDRIGSTLTAAKMQVEAAANQITTDSVNLKKGQNLLDQAISDTRMISHNMISGVLIKLGLEAALKDLSESLEITDQLAVKLDIKNLPRLNSELELQLFRITQELAGNAIRHSKATELYIKLRLKGDRLTLEVQDNGKGFDPAKQTKGIGMQNVERRLEAIGGLLDIQSIPNEGSKFTIELNTSDATNQDTTG